MRLQSLPVSFSAAGLGLFLFVVLVLAARETKPFEESSESVASFAHGKRLPAADSWTRPEVEPAQPIETKTIPPVQRDSLSSDWLTGGNRERGEKIFFEKPEAMCSKCHAVNGRGGAVGPDLTRIGSQRQRSEIVESLLDPDRVIAPEFRTLLVQTLDGSLVFGVVKEEGPDVVRIVDVEAKEHRIPLDEIDDRRPGRSAMPADLRNQLRPDELRDLVEYLARLTGS